MRVWVEDNLEAWVPACIVDVVGDSTIAIKTETNESIAISNSLSKGLEPVDEAGLEKDVDNLVDLESFSEGIILHHVRERFKRGLIYTGVGSIVIAVNPFKALPLYGERAIQDYRSHTQSNTRCPPHVYQVSGTAYRTLEETSDSQSILISGESGSGKTETTKMVLQFLASVAKSPSHECESISVEEQILHSNPILEAFGNAKTLRNDNSSRFGKYLKMDFDERHQIVGSTIMSYLLEKVRVVSPQQGERNFHVFYMLLAETWEVSHRARTAHSSPHDFDLLNQSTCISIETRNEASEWQELVIAFEKLGYTTEEFGSLIDILGALLYLGNVSFSSQQEERVEVSNHQDLHVFADILSLDGHNLQDLFLYREIQQPRGQPIRVPRGASQASSQLYALIKDIYGSLFCWLIDKVNARLQLCTAFASIGILDIFGFEIFPVNSMEQLCINFANEKLQSFFNTIVFEEEIQLYKAEGIPLDSVSFTNNCKCLEMIEGKGGIFAQLDEEGKLPGGCTERWVQKLHHTFAEDKCTSSEFYGRNPKKPESFVVHHFANSVTYSSEKFLDKNIDILDQRIKSLMGESKHNLCKVLTEQAMAKSSKLSLGSRFKMDLNNLMETLHTTAPHFIRCVKPNQDKVAGEFSSKLVLEQLKNAGVFQAIKIRRAGYQYHITMDQFVRRFHICLQKEKIGSTFKHQCQTLVADLIRRYSQKFEVSSRKGNFSLSEELKVGETKVFIRTIAAKGFLEEVRVAQLDHFSRCIQSFMRMAMTRLKTWDDGSSWQERRDELRRKRQSQDAQEDRKNVMLIKIQALCRRFNACAQAVKRKQAREEIRLRQIRADQIEQERQKKDMAASIVIGMFRVRQARNCAHEKRLCQTLERALGACNTALLKADHINNDDSELLNLAVKHALSSSSWIKERPRVRFLTLKAVELRKMIGKIHELETDLLKLSQSKNVAALTNLLKAAEQVGLQKSKSVERAQAQLCVLTQSAKLEQELKFLISTKDASKLVDHAPEIRKILEASEELELSLDVRRLAERRLQWTLPFETLRNQLREAVEVVSVSRMLELIEKIQLYVPLLGAMYCKREVEVAKKLIKLVQLEEEYSMQRSLINQDVLLGDMKLPPHVFDHFLSRGGGQNETLDCQPFHEYLRYFKWVQSLAFWRFETGSSVKLGYEQESNPTSKSLNVVSCSIHQWVVQAEKNAIDQIRKTPKKEAKKRSDENLFQLERNLKDALEELRSQSCVGDYLFSDSRTPGHQINIRPAPLPAKNIRDWTQRRRARKDLHFRQTIARSRPIPQNSAVSLAK